MKAGCGHGRADVEGTPRERFLVLAPSLGEGGGIQRVGDDFVRALVDRPGAVVEVYAWRSAVAGGDAVPGVRSDRFRCGNARGSLLRFVAGAIRRMLVPRSRVFIMHVGFLPLCMLMRFPALRQRVTLMLYGIESWRSLTGFRQRGLRNVDSLLSISRTTKVRFYTANPACTAPCQVIRPCLPCDWFDALPAPSGAETTTAAPSGCDVLCVGRMAANERYKGYDELLDALVVLRGRGSNVHVVFVGDGDDRKRLMQRAGELGVAGSTSWPGFVSLAVLRDYYRACRVFAMPSRGEGFGLVYGEAMSFGKPFIAGRDDAGGELAEASGCGVAVDPANAGQLADAVMTFVNMPGDKRAALARKAATWARDALGYQVFRTGLHGCLDAAGSGGS